MDYQYAPDPEECMQSTATYTLHEPINFYQNNQLA